MELDYLGASPETVKAALDIVAGKTAYELSLWVRDIPQNPDLKTRQLLAVRQPAVFIRVCSGFVAALLRAKPLVEKSGVVELVGWPSELARWRTFFAMVHRQRMTVGQLCQGAAGCRVSAEECDLLAGLDGSPVRESWLTMTAVRRAVVKNGGPARPDYFEMGWVRMLVDFAEILKALAVVGYKCPWLDEAVRTYCYPALAGKAV